MDRLDQAWYERAADIINSSYSAPQERIDLFNDLWCAYLFALLQLKRSKESTLATIRQTLENTMAIIANTDNKETIENGTNETQTTAADAEQLG